MGAKCCKCCCSCCTKSSKTEATVLKRPKGGKQLHDYKVSSLAALSIVEKHKARIQVLLEEHHPQHADFETEKDAMCHHVTDKYETATLKPLENEFNSGYWKPNARRSKLKCVHTSR